MPAEILPVAGKPQPHQRWLTPSPIQSSAQDVPLLRRTLKTEFHSDNIWSRTVRCDAEAGPLVSVDGSSVVINNVQGHACGAQLLRFHYRELHELECEPFPSPDWIDDESAEAAKVILESQIEVSHRAVINQLGNPCTELWVAVHLGQLRRHEGPSNSRAGE
jgi:hypothetical protein